MKKIFNEMIILFIIAIAVKLYITMGLPRWIVGDAPHDDMMLMNYAKNIVSGNWLGAYSNLTLNKRPGYAFFLASAYELHIPYALALTLFDILAAWVSVCAVRQFLKKSWERLLWFTFFVFNPIAFDNAISQRIYRNALIPDAVLLVVFSLTGLYLRRREKKITLIGWGVLSGISVSFFWIIREDSMWMLPFVSAALLITILLILMDWQENFKERIERVVICCIPVLFTMISLSALKGINYYRYGIYTLSDFNDTNFAYAIKNILRVAPEEEKPYLWVQKETMEQLYDVSPGLALLKEGIDAQYQGGWQEVGLLREDGEIEKDYIIWAIRDAASREGYYKDAKETDELFKKIGDEIGIAFKEGKLKEREGITISSLARPVSFENWDLWLDCMEESLRWTISYEKCMTANYNSSGSEDNIRLAEVITNGVLIYPERDFMVKGWLISKNKDNLVRLEVGNGDYRDVSYTNELRSDVLNLYGNDYEITEDCGFTISGKSNSEDIILNIVTMDGEVLTNVTANYMETDEFILYIDTILDQNVSKDMINKSSAISKTGARAILKFYQIVSPCLFIITLIIFAVTILAEIVKMIKERKWSFEDYEIIIPAAGFLLSILVLHLGVSINYFDAWNRSNRIVYLGGSYPLQLGFIALMIVLGIKKINNLRSISDKK